VQRGKTHIGTCDEDRRTQHRILIRIVLQPSEELTNAIDLIIVTTVSANQETMRTGGRKIQVARVRITEAGRRALEE